VITSNGHSGGKAAPEQNGAQVQLEPMAPPKVIPPLKVVKLPLLIIIVIFTVLIVIILRRLPGTRL
jgi:hypothetical protein